MAFNDTSPTDVEKDVEKRVTFSLNSSKEKKLLIALIILAILGCVVIITLTVLLVLGFKYTKPDICLTEDCIKTAADLLSSIDDSHDPCDDFHMFSCGKWIKEHSSKRAAAEGFIKSSNKLQRMIKNELEMAERNQPKSVQKFVKAYKSCLNYDGFHALHEGTLRRILNSLGGMPLLERYWDFNDDYEWTEGFSRAFNIFKIKCPFYFAIEPNLYNTSENVIYLKAPFVNILKKLDFVVIEEVAMKLGDNTNTTVLEDIEDLKKMEEFIFNISVNSKLLQENEYRLGSIQELNHLYPSIDWLLFLRNLFENYFEAIDYVITKREKVLIEGISYMQKLLDAIETGKITERTLANYIAATFIDELFTVYKITKVSPELQENLCYRYFFENLPFVVDYIYGKHRKEKYVEDSMVKYGFKAMNQLVSEAKWLDSQTKKEVKEKLDAMKYHPHFPPFTQDARMLDKYYEELPEISDNTFENQIIIDVFVIEKSLQRINSLNNRSEWYRTEEAPGTMSNAFQFLEMNSVYLPAGIQVYPFFVAGRPNFVNFGTMGLILGHEITHGLDKTGSMKDKTGNFRDWWTVEAKTEFDRGAQCFIDQYDAYEYGGNTNKHVNGTTTLSENIADNGGIRQSFLAYKLWEKDHGKELTLPGLQKYTTYQLFFIAFATSWCTGLNPEELYLMHSADEHSPDKFRIIGSLSNMKEFAEAFNCKVGSKMNPKNKCVIW